MDGSGLSSKKLWLQCNIDASIESDWDCTLEDAVLFIGQNMMYPALMLETINHSKLNVDKVYSIEDWSRLLEDDFVPGEHFVAKYIYENHKYLVKRLYSKITRLNKKYKSFVPYIIGFVGGFILLKPIAWLDGGIMRLLAMLFGFNIKTLSDDLIISIVFFAQIGLLCLFLFSKFLITEFVDVGRYIANYNHKVIRSKLRGISTGENSSRTLTKVGLTVDIVVQEEDLETKNKLRSVLTSGEFKLAGLGQFDLLGLNFTPISLRGVEVFTASGDLVANKNVLPYGYRRHYNGNNAFTLFAPIAFYTILYFHALALGFMLIFNLF